MQRPADGKPLVAETRPAFLLKREGIRRPCKKGRKSFDGRACILQRLEESGIARCQGRTLRRRILENRDGDALDF